MKRLTMAAVLAAAACGGSLIPVPATAADDAANAAHAAQLPAGTTIEIGQSCTFATSSSCAAGGQCWVQSTTFFCSAECETPTAGDNRSRPCAAGYGCAPFAGAFGLCFKTCAAAGGCPAGTTCIAKNSLCEPALSPPF